MPQEGMISLLKHGLRNTAQFNSHDKSDGEEKNTKLNV